MCHEAPNHVRVEDWGISRLALEYMLDGKDGCQPVTWEALVGSGTSSISRDAADVSESVPGRKNRRQAGKNKVFESDYWMGRNPPSNQGRRRHIVIDR